MKFNIKDKVAYGIGSIQLVINLSFVTQICAAIKIDCAATPISYRQVCSIQTGQQNITTLLETFLTNKL